MPVDRSYLDRNEKSRAALTALVEGLSDEDCGRLTEEGGWTVGQVLCHMAFWDRFHAARWRTAEAVGEAMPIAVGHELADPLNDALAGPFLAFSEATPDVARKQCLAAANAIDGLIAALPQTTPFEAILADRPSALDRSEHREKHIAQMRRALTDR